METRPEGPIIVKIYRVRFLKRDRETSKNVFGSVSTRDGTGSTLG
jgi:hypothetical protein